MVTELASEAETVPSELASEAGQENTAATGASRDDVDASPRPRGRPGYGRTQWRVRFNGPVMRFTTPDAPRALFGYFAGL